MADEAPHTLALLNAELEQVREEHVALRTKHPGSTMPEEARAQDADLVRRSNRLTAAIVVEQQKQNDAVMEETAKFLDDPVHRVPKAVNPDDESRRVIARHGWDIRNGMIYRKTSQREIAFVAEDVLFGPIPNGPDDAVAAQHFKQMRAIFQPEYRAAWMRYVKSRGDRAALPSTEQAALSEGTDATGGYLVPPDIQAEILARRADASVMRQMATVRQTSRDRMQFPAVTPHGSSGSIYSSGFVGGLVGETPATNTDNGPTFQQFEIGIKKFEAYTKVSNDLIADAASDLMAFLAADGGRNLGLVEDNYFLTGNGTGLQPLGLLNTGLTTADVQGTTSDEVSNSVSDAGSAPKIVALSYLVPAQYVGNARWLMARATQGKIHGLVDADARPWWQAAASAGGESGAPPTLLGSRVMNSPFMPVGGTNGNKVLVYGDFSAYVIADRTALSVRVDDLNLIGTDETQIFLRSRAGGGLWNTDALRVGIV
jgi:HK97 family phage major capsid protein